MATRAQIRENLVEDWLAEANSDFYTDPILNDGIYWAYREVARVMGGVDTRWDTDTKITFPYEYSVPRDLIFPEKFTYNPAGPSGAGVKELDLLQYDDMFVLYGREWIDDAAATPEVIYFRGWMTFGLYPRAGSVITNGISVFGRGVPSDFSSDNATALTPQVYDDTIGAGAYVYCLRRFAAQNGGRMPQNFQDALSQWGAGLTDAKAFARRIATSDLVIVGSMPNRRTRWSPWGRPWYDFES